jgi:hypothetical protein
MNAYAERLESSNALGSVTEVLVDIAVTLGSV